MANEAIFESQLADRLDEAPKSAASPPPDGPSDGPSNGSSGEQAARELAGPPVAAQMPPQIDEADWPELPDDLFAGEEQALPAPMALRHFTGRPTATSGGRAAGAKGFAIGLAIGGLLVAAALSWSELQSSLGVHLDTADDGVTEEQATAWLADSPVPAAGPQEGVAAARTSATAEVPAEPMTQTVSSEDRLSESPDGGTAEERSSDAVPGAPAVSSLEPEAGLEQPTATEAAPAPTVKAPGEETADSLQDGLPKPPDVEQEAAGPAAGVTGATFEAAAGQDRAQDATVLPVAVGDAAPAALPVAPPESRVASGPQQSAPSRRADRVPGSDRPAAATEDATAVGGGTQTAALPAEVPAPASSGSQATGAGDGVRSPTQVEAGSSLTWPERRSVQQALRVLGYDPGPLDGVIGEQTRRALMAFQEANGFAPLGELDADLKDLLLRRAAESRAAGYAKPTEARRKVGVTSGAPAQDAGPKQVARVRYPGESELQFLERLAEDGDPLAQTNLGLRYYHGRDGKRDLAKAAYWYERAAEQGDPTAQTNLGLLYFNGQGVATDRKEAARWSLAAAMQGNATAQYNLGLLYQNGSGVPRDLRKASHWFRKAAEKGEPGAEAQLQEVLKALQGRAEDQGTD